MIKKLLKVGGSLVVALPKEMLSALELDKHSRVHVEMVDGAIVIKHAPKLESEEPSGN